jgi:hypothetical protein
MALPKGGQPQQSNGGKQQEKSGWLPDIQRRRKYSVDLGPIHKSGVP